MDIRNILKDKLFWMLSISLAGIIFVAAMNANHVYQAEIEVIFIPKQEAIAIHMDQVLGNAEHLTTLLAFYDRILEDNPEIEDETREMLPAERKDFWNGTIAAERIKGSSIVKIVAQKDGRSQAEAIAIQSAQSLTAVMSRFYDIRTDLNMRIVDDPIVSQIEKIGTVWRLLMSLLLGVFFGSVLHVAIDLGVKSLSVKKIERIERRMDFPKMKPSIFPRVSLPERFVKKEFPLEKKNVFDFKTEEETVLTYERKDPVVLSREKKSGAPANLPIAEDFNLDAIKEEDFFAHEDDSRASVEPLAEKSAEVITHEEPAEHLFREATPEEVKARLNKLLSGDMLK